jgi:SAM-dependent methyltransferase
LNVLGIGRRSSPRDVFSDIYRTEHWRGGSGAGSSPEAQAHYRDTLRRVLDEPRIASVVDVGCGDWQCSGLVDWARISHVGVDVVPAVVARNAADHGSDGVRFRCLDATRVSLPPAQPLWSEDYHVGGAPGQANVPPRRPAPGLAVLAQASVRDHTAHGAARRTTPER